MTVIIDGTTGIQVPDGSGSVPSYSNDGDGNTGLFFPAADTIAFAEGGSEIARFDSSGNFGIGTTSPVSKLHVKDSAISVQSSSFPALKFLDGSGNTDAELYFGAGGGDDFNINNYVNGPMIFRTNNAERARFTGGGFLLIGTTTSKVDLTVQGQGAFGSTTSATTNGIYLYINDTVSDNSFLSRGSAGVGTTTWYIGNQAITTSSDVRLKENIVDTTRNATEIVNKLRVVDHTWNDPSDKSVNNRNSRGVWMGLIAQEAIEHIPWLVNKPVEDESPDGSKNYWHMDYGYAVPLLVKAIQELKAELDATKAKVAALEGK